MKISVPAPLLQNLEYGGLGLPPYIPPFQRWHQLKILTFTRIFDDQCIVLLQQCPQLTKCTFGDIVRDRLDSQSFPPLTLPDLRTFEILRCVYADVRTVLSLLTVPALCHLTLGEPFGLPAVDQWSVDDLSGLILRSSCPLETITIEGEPGVMLPSENLIQFIRNVPSLREFILKRSRHGHTYIERLRGPAGRNGEEDLTSRDER